MKRKRSRCKNFAIAWQIGHPDSDERSHRAPGESEPGPDRSSCGNALDWSLYVCGKGKKLVRWEGKQEAGKGEMKITEN